MERIYKSGITILFIIPPKICGDIGWYNKEELHMFDFVKIHKILNHYNCKFNFISDCGFYWLRLLDGNDCGCIAGKSGIAIACDGSVSPCPFYSKSEFYAGNIREKSLLEIQMKDCFDYYFKYIKDSEFLSKEAPCMMKF